MVKATVCKTVPGPSSFRTLPCQVFHGAQSSSGHASDEALRSMIENGERKSPSLPVLKRLAKTLGVPVTALLE